MSVLRLRGTLACRKPRSDDDPPPVPPKRPDDEDCCHGGCERCVYDLYEEARERYEEARLAWEERRKQRTV